MKRVALTVALLAAACSEKEPEPEVVDKPKCTEAAPCLLASGVALLETIGVKGEADHFRIEVPAATGRSLVRVQLVASAPVTPVRYAFTILAPDGTTLVGTRGPTQEGGKQVLDATFLTTTTGAHRILVRDANGQARDVRNGYALTATVFADPDSGEPDAEPSNARALPLAPDKASGFVAWAGDRELLSFETTGQGGLVKVSVAQEVSGGPVRLRARVLRLDPAHAGDVQAATPVVEQAASKAGQGAAIELSRFYSAGKYLLEITDFSGLESDATAQAAWTAWREPIAETDAQETPVRNDTPATATALVPGASALEGSIGSQGDRDWFAVTLAASETPQVLEIRFDPKTTNSEIQTLWAVGEVLAAPAGNCDASCGPTMFCDGLKCAHRLRALRGYAKDDVTPQVVRVAHQGPARTIRVLVSDQGDDGHTTRAYSLSAELKADPDAHETPVTNDRRAAPTPLEPQVEGGGAITFSGEGKISWWEYVDGRATYQQAADGDWYELRMPPRELAPDCVDGIDAGPCNPVWDADAGEPDAGPVYAPLPRYGLAMRWHGPTDEAYRLGLQGVVSIDGSRTACRFSFDERFAHPDGGSFSFGDVPSDPCLCLPARQAEQGRVWVKVEAAHRADPPERNRYSDLPYAFDLVLTPNALQTTCAQKCDAVTQPSTCPGE